MGVTVDDGRAVGATVERESSAVTRKMSVARVGVWLGVRVAVGVLVAVGVEVPVAVRVGVIVGVLVGVSVGRTAIVGNSEMTSLLPILKARRAITPPRMTRAVIPNNHFFTRSTPIFALAHLPHSTKTGVESSVILHGRNHQF